MFCSLRYSSLGTGSFVEFVVVDDGEDAGVVVEFVVVAVGVDDVRVVKLEFEDVVEAGLVLVVVVVGDGAEGVGCFVRFELTVVERAVGCFVVVVNAVVWAGCIGFVVVAVDKLSGVVADCTVRGDSEDGLADEYGDVLCRGFVGTIERSTWSERRRVCFQKELHRLKTDVVLVFHQRLQEESRSRCCESGGAG